MPGVVSVSVSSAPALRAGDPSAGRPRGHGDSGGPQLQSGGARLPLRAEPSAPRQAATNAQGENRSAMALFVFPYWFFSFSEMIVGWLLSTSSSFALTKASFLWLVFTYIDPGIAARRS